MTHQEILRPWITFYQYIFYQTLGNVGASRLSKLRKLILDEIYYLPFWIWHLGVPQYLLYVYIYIIHVLLVNVNAYFTENLKQNSRSYRLTFNYIIYVHILYVLIKVRLSDATKVLECISDASSFSFPGPQTPPKHAKYHLATIFCRRKKCNRKKFPGVSLFWYLCASLHLLGRFELVGNTYIYVCICVYVCVCVCVLKIYC